MKYNIAAKFQFVIAGFTSNPQRLGDAGIHRHDERAAKSRSDGTLLTVGFNLREEDAVRHVSTNPAGMTLLRLMKVSSHAGLYATCVTFSVRRLKPTVNKVLSLRDSSSLTTIFAFLFLCCSSGLLLASDNTYPTDNRLFHIERSKNKNIVCYDLNTYKTGVPDEKKPLSVYWINREEHPGQRDELSYIQEKLAYGYTVAGNQNGMITIELNAVKNRKITLERNHQTYLCRIEINRQPAILQKIYVKTKSPNSLQVEYVDLQGIDLATRTPVTERFYP